MSLSGVRALAIIPKKAWLLAVGTATALIILPGFIVDNPKAEQENEVSDIFFTLHSEILNEDRVLRISTPDDYAQTNRRYPVLYQLDGEYKHFAAAVNDIKSLSSLGDIPEMIVVGIENTDRWRDMLPVKLKKYPTSGEAIKFYEFIRNEMIPFVEENYRANQLRLLFGQSNSALFTIYAFTEGADIFNAYIASSPSLGHCSDYIFDRILAFLDGHSEPDRFLFISNGGQDTAARLVAPISEFIGVVEKKGPGKLVVKYKYYEKEGHCPASTLGDGLVSGFRERSTGISRYFNPRPPGLSPEGFAPGLISSAEHAETGCAFTPDGGELYFTRSGGGLNSPTIFVSRFQDYGWTWPEETEIEGFGPSISPDGRRMYISRYGRDERGQRAIELWFSSREREEWGDFLYHGLGNRASMSRSSNLYFVDRSDEEDRGVIVVQQLINGEFSEPVRVGGGINSSHYEAHPFIAGDESYIVFDSNRPGGYGEGDLYVCFRDSDGAWGEAINLGPAVNTEKHEGYAAVSPDGKHLFYSSNKDGDYDLYWIDAKIIENVGQ